MLGAGYGKPEKTTASIMDEFAPVSSFNRKALIGFVLSILAMLALCSGLLPIPLTVLICYPPGLVLGIASLVLGLVALHELRSDGKNGQPFAWFSAWMGGLTILGMLCLASTAIVLLPYISNFFQQAVQNLRP